METTIKAENISMTFHTPRGSTTALKDVNLEVYDGELLVLLGPSGCGKSTLLRILSGLQKPTSGKVTLADNFSFKKIGFVFQQFALLPWLSVYQNVELNLLTREPSSARRREIVMEHLKEFGLSKFKDSHPRDLSGGMRQRVGLARAFALKPEVIFMDEPFSELDSFTAEVLRAKLLEAWREEKQTIVMVSHNVEETVKLADRIAVMTTRPGRIEAIVENKLERPRVRRSDAFFDLEDKLYKLVEP